MVSFSAGWALGASCAHSALLTLWASCALWADRTGFAPFTLRAGWANWSSNALRAHGTRSTGFPLRTLSPRGTCRSDFALWTCRTGDTLHTLVAFGTGGALRANLSLVTFGAGGTRGSGWTYFAL
ncbi:hypothetical protein [Hymenobacter persicinus]|uniref:hypothetical protein n=1 Tax=Hymenobacter persicinus TaxID=2025506 RepID=UPI001F5D9D37|nr:hypothetical protein [Hymenobacter persicinus]